MSYRVQIYCEAGGVPSPLDPQTVVAETARAAAEKLAGGTLLEAGPHGRLAAFVWGEGEFKPHRVPFYRP
jgi:hypothetical protein